MKKVYALAFLLALCAAPGATAREAKLVRYPHYNHGRVVFTYLADIWTADEDGKNIKRITANKARDVYPRFSPDGKWIAFSSDRNGNFDVFIVSSEGGAVKQLTFHSSDDTVLGWTPDSRQVLFASNRGDDFMGKLYTISIDGGMERNAGSDMGVNACYSPDGKKLAINRKGQVYWRKYYRGAMNTDVTVMDIAAKKFTDPGRCGAPMASFISSAIVKATASPTFGGSRKAAAKPTELPHSRPVMFATPA
jgi:tricorn protease